MQEQLEGHVKISINEGIASVTFHHPKSNSLPSHILKGMADAISVTGRDPQVRVIILRSDGDKAFCAGASFDELLAIDSEETGQKFFSGFARVINAIRTVPVFVIGRIHAHAVGGGVGLACAVDIAYAHKDASVRLSELAVGIGPFVVGPAVERKVGPGGLAELSATPALRRSSEWCLRRGIFSEVFDSMEALDARIDSHARELAGYGPEAMAELKKITWAGTEDWEDLLQRRAAISGRLVMSEFTSKAIEKFKTGVK